MSEDRSERAEDMSAAAGPLTPEVRLRRMRISDLDVLLRYEQEMFGPEAWSRRGYLEELSDRKQRHYLVAEKVAESVAEKVAESVAEEAAEPPGSHLLGTGGLLTIGETSQILTLAVLPPARRTGVGRLLVRALIAEARRRRAGEVLLEVREDNEPAQRLYATEGFTVLGRRRGYYEQGRVDAITMRYEIERPAPEVTGDEG
ncbi:MAG TPA: GNAT family N-acetyltransferase [Jatrophihabitans sp.]|jgi:ribosomal-protein-alanine N-acetyltransferase|uniref:GNAT family N-acetyltransferase n=1 Tax=Jatrophihabitans sp. TaxID=1932789 RepID=UPI002F125502